jgi:hypothetical protein
MRALARWRDREICPACGYPKSVCQDPGTENAVHVLAPTRCHVTTALREAQEAYRHSPGARPDGLLWNVDFDTN